MAMPLSFSMVDFWWLVFKALSVEIRDIVNNIQLSIKQVSIKPL